MTTKIKEPNEVYDEIQRRTDGMIAVRAHAQDIANYARKELLLCSGISCFDCPMNIGGANEIVCITLMKIVR